MNAAQENIQSLRAAWAAADEELVHAIKTKAPKDHRIGLTAKRASITESLLAAELAFSH